MSLTLDDSDVAFLAARIRRLCKTFGQPVDDVESDEFVVGTAGSLIGLLLSSVERKEPVCWIRYCSDDTYEGPVMHRRMERVRIESGAWTPLVVKPMQPTKSGADNMP
jgi:hypothetical protein